MKLERLLSIIILLLNRRMVQAKELAERFEVSIRTIYRDVETINMAGIPIVTYQGANGGISLAEGYRLDRNILTNDELASIVTALRSISTSYGEVHHKQLMEKMNSVVLPNEAESFQDKTNRVLIDYSPWDGQERLQAKLDLLKGAIDQEVIVTFVYSDAQGKVTKRSAEPHTLILKGKQWYLQAYCLEKEQFRLFKLNRIKDLLINEEQVFTRRQVPSSQNIAAKGQGTSSETTTIVLQFQEEARHLAEDWFGVEELIVTETGGWQVRKQYPEDEWLYGFILGFGPYVEVIEPLHVREIIAKRAAQIAAIYHP
ncbi:helix-turn-helix transcriptional regulator [Gracilibacillus alcaliphilus]|uniref:helix-turn-helix transcriptional regulator n=1 Tax=Gracilibacillus alcaliphilus TaxID=1401441 RepID=UPI001958A274|nr:YafY family protein [Gracilibacillus alcaliphilus]MBM7675598.1 putative DNA-binding transcriptional regulator YafY [Gracilibacillus alcaliphilus]